MPPRKIDVSGFDPDGAGADAGIFGLSHQEDDASVVLIPVPWDATTSYRRGTANAWRAIRDASRQIDLLDLGLADLGLPRPWEFGIHLRSARIEIERRNRDARRLANPIVAHGGPTPDGALDDALSEVNRHSEAVNVLVGGDVASLLDAGKLVGTIGGDHSISLGAIAAHAQRHPGLGLLQIDAHADLRRAYEGFRHSHASIIDNVLASVPGVASVTQVAVRDVGHEELARIRSDDRLTTFFDHEMRARMFAGETFSTLVEAIVASLPERVYVTFDIDGLDPALCPNTGTPVPGGLLFAETVYLLTALARSGRTIVGFDLTEVAPAPSGDPWDGNVAARILYKLIGICLWSQGARS